MRNEDDIETLLTDTDATQLENSRYASIRSPRPEPDIPFSLFERPEIIDIQHRFPAKLRNLRTTVVPSSVSIKSRMTHISTLSSNSSVTLPAATAAPTPSNTVLPSEIINLMRFESSMMNSYIHPLNPPIHHPSNLLLYPANPINPSYPSNSSSNLSNPSSNPSNSSNLLNSSSSRALRSSPIPRFGEHADLFIEEFFTWLKERRPRRAGALLSAKEVIQNEGFELDIIRHLTNEQVVQLNIGMGIFVMIRQGSKHPEWLARLKNIKVTLAKEASGTNQQWRRIITAPARINEQKYKLLA
ncbi:hypothetical protein AJ78_03664 [Emergomyces pasteurianus Ep9510]|uniref:Uncharacterized protein n=1 Tax=Emergomyces pasteurianus Ep9510 TaxID=1447872 RepID=A0A1J9PI46_9EURO|nr:hypothetical protein AJ78_03664 [Emergomyces pasteurianus Ep9510]